MKGKKKLIICIILENKLKMDDLNLKKKGGTKDSFYNSLKHACFK